MKHIIGTIVKYVSVHYFYLWNVEAVKRHISVALASTKHQIILKMESLTDVHNAKKIKAAKQWVTIKCKS